MKELEHCRIDKWLWACRFFKTRSISHKFVEHGKVRLNGRKLRKPSTLLRITDVITLTRGDSVIVVRVLSLPLHRGSAKNSADWYANI